MRGIKEWSRPVSEVVARGSGRLKGNLRQLISVTVLYTLAAGVTSKGNEEGDVKPPQKEDFRC